MRSKALLGALLGLSGCVTIPTAVQQPVPSEFLAVCRALEVDIRTNGDLAKALQAHKRALEECNIDKEAIRSWSNGLTQGKSDD